MGCISSGMSVPAVYVSKHNGCVIEYVTILSLLQYLYIYCIHFNLRILHLLLRRWCLHIAYIYICNYTYNFI